MTVGVPIVDASARFAEQHIKAGTASASIKRGIWVIREMVFFIILFWFVLRFSSDSLVQRQGWLPLLPGRRGVTSTLLHRSRLTRANILMLQYAAAYFSRLSPKSGMPWNKHDLRSTGHQRARKGHGIEPSAATNRIPTQVEQLDSANLLMDNSMTFVF